MATTVATPQKNLHGDPKKNGPVSAHHHFISHVLTLERMARVPAMTVVRNMVVTPVENEAC
jgi:hypothetical protein